MSSDTAADKKDPGTNLPAKTTTDTLALVPSFIEEEDKLATFAAEQNLARMAILDPDKVEKAMNALARVLKTMREIAIKDTVGIDWTLYKDRDGNEVGVIRDSGAVKARKWLGISIFNHRHDDGSGKGGPRVYDESVPQGEGKAPKKVQVVAGIADGICSRTGESIQAVYFAVRNEPQEFTGRKDEKTKLSNLTDVLSTWRTGIDAKVVRILGGLRKLPKEELDLHGVNTAKCYKGRGYGTSAERAASGAADVGLGDVLELMRAEIVRRTGGNMLEGKNTVKTITSSPKTARSKGFAGWDTLDKLTAKWQVDKAWENLVKHPKYGNKALGMPDDQLVAPWDRPKPEAPAADGGEDQMGDPSQPQPEEREPGAEG